ncbi:hypothetical protein Pfo_005439 [Paulownia fortunei]|nr:hypothetical protein Pfo_005439 [Paulownia fortunei]
MEGRVQVIAREIIKPSSETPHHLKKFKLSYLDQLAPSVYFPVVFFYQADELRGLTISNHVRISQQLKQSLSDTLTSFYPLAGRIEDNFVVDCSDAGVGFIEARVHAQLMDAIQEPNMEELKQYLPMDPTTAGGLGEGTLFFVQINLFDCGGIAIGVCFSHQIADCTSIMAFVNAWAATCRGEAEISRFSFDLANYFPAGDFLGSRFSGFPMSDDKFMTKRFVFEKEKLAALKQAATSPSRSTVKNPTRVELVSAFIWKCFLEVAKFNNLHAKRILAAFHVVNLRTRTSPPQLLENVFGNCTMLALALSNTNVESEQYKRLEEFHDLVSKLRSSIRTISDDYITKAQSGDSYLNDHYEVFSLLSKGELVRCSFSSWCRLPVYDVDYGWGNPIWLCTTALPSKNLTVLVSSRCGEGIEAWVNMNQDNLEMLETQIKLISTNVNDMES